MTILGGQDPAWPVAGRDSIFFDVLAEFAGRSRNPDVGAIRQRFGSAPTVSVLGRRGVGSGAVTAALDGSGISVVDDATDAGVRVLVVAEAVKPEERALAAGAEMVVLNKADLGGATSAGLLADAQRRALEFAAALDRPVVPMIAHLANVVLDEADVAALHAMATAPADMSSTDAFVGADHQLTAEVRGRLLAKLDRLGLAHAVRGLAQGETPAVVTRQLRELSQVDRVVEQLTAVSAPERYRRVRGAVRELHALAAQSGDDELAAFLASDDVVVAVMAAAVELMAAAGFTVEGPWDGDADAQLRRAERWTARARGPLEGRYQLCATDIARGSLRLLERLR